VTFRLVALYLNQLRYRVSPKPSIYILKFHPTISYSNQLTNLTNQLRNSKAHSPSVAYTFSVRTLSFCYEIKNAIPMLTRPRYCFMSSDKLFQSNPSHSSYKEQFIIVPSIYFSVFHVTLSFTSPYKTLYVRILLYPSSVLHALPISSSLICLP
jgi:hypothetical protein